MQKHFYTPAMTNEKIKLKRDWCLGGLSGDQGNRAFREKTMKAGTRVTAARGFPGGLRVKTPCSQRKERGFDPWSGNEDCTCLTVRPKT